MNPKATKPRTKVRRETALQGSERWARALLRIIHPTVPPARSDVQRVAYALRAYDAEMRARRRGNRASRIAESRAQ